MGGPGSGRWIRLARKKTVDDFKTIDIRQWAKNCGLENKKFKAGWKSDGNITGSIDVQTSPDWVQLDYRQYIGGRWHTRQQRITLVYTSCHYGNGRAWFCCPGLGCGLRRAKLVLGDDGFYCRKCYKLRLYRCQTSTKLDRLLQKRVDLEERMYGDDGWFKRGMHFNTRRRLMAKYTANEDKIAEELGALSPAMSSS